MKAAIYCRVSTRDKQNIETQEQYLKEFAAREQLEVYNIYSDVGESGSKDSRPAFDAMLQDMRQGKFKAILTYKLDRIGRSLSHLVKLFEEFKAKQIDFISATQAINTTSPEGRMFLHMLMTLAEYERELTVSRINIGLDRIKQGINKDKQFITKSGKTITNLGRPKGSKDRKRRRTSGYINRWIKQSTPTNNVIITTQTQSKTTK